MATVGVVGADRHDPESVFRDDTLVGICAIRECRVPSVSKDLRKFGRLGDICAYPNLTPVPFPRDDLWTGYPGETKASYGAAEKALLSRSRAAGERYGLAGICALSRHPRRGNASEPKVKPDSVWRQLSWRDYLMSGVLGLS